MKWKKIKKLMTYDIINQLYYCFSDSYYHIKRLINDIKTTY